MKITIDPQSGFCFGVVFAIKAAEEELERSGQLYCLGDIVRDTLRRGFGFRDDLVPFPYGPQVHRAGASAGIDGIFAIDLGAQSTQCLLDAAIQNLIV